MQPTIIISKECMTVFGYHLAQARGQLCAEWAQSVSQRSNGPALRRLHLHGQDRSLTGHPQAAVHDPFVNGCRQGVHYVLNGHKWWASGAMDPRCALCIFMGKTDPSAVTHKQQSMILVPMSAPGVRIVRPLTVFGYDDAPHGHAEMLFKVHIL